MYFWRKNLNTIVGFTFLTTNLLGMVCPLANAQMIKAEASAGAGSGGGGSTVEFPNHSVVSADPFAIKLDNPFGDEARTLTFTGQEYQFNSDDQESLKSAFDLMTIYQADRTEDFAKNQVFAKDIHYYIVNQLPIHPMCQQTPILPDLPVGGIPSGSFCTIGNLTFILDKPFARLSRIDQTIELIHERLRAWRPGLSVEVISAVTTGVQTLLILKDLKQTQGHYSITPQQLRSLRNMLMGFSMTQLTSMQDLPTKFKIAAQGGGIYYGQMLDDKSLIESGQRLFVTSEKDFQSIHIFDTPKLSSIQIYGTGAEINNVSPLAYEVHGAVFDYAKISNSTLNSFLVGANAELDHVKGEIFRIKDNAHVINVDVGNRNFDADAGSSASNVNARSVSLGRNAIMKNITSNIDLTVGDQAKLQDSTFDFSERVPSLFTLKGDSEVSHVELSEKIINDKKDYTVMSQSIQIHDMKLLNVGPTTLYYQQFGTDMKASFSFHDQKNPIWDFEGKPLDSVCEPGKHLLMAVKGHLTRDTAIIMSTGGVITALGYLAVDKIQEKKAKSLGNNSEDVNITSREDLKKLCKSIPGVP